MWHPTSLHMHTTTEILTTTACHLLPWAVLCKSTSNQTDTSHRVSIQATAGTSQHPQITTDATIFLSRATRAKPISDTVYFKHKHITQPSLTTEDLVIKTIRDLSNAIKGGKNLGSSTQIEAITRLTNALRPGNELPLHDRSPRVQIDTPPRVQFDAPPRVQIDAPPMVQFNTEANQELPFDADTIPRLIVESLAASTRQQQPQPMPILKQPSIISSESIADRVNKRRGTLLSSIAEHVA